MELASCLVHCAMESISGDTTHWFGHHVGAYEVIRSATTLSGQESPDLTLFRRTFEGRWLLRSFAYHDIMMAVVEDRKPLLVAGEYWAFPEHNSADSYFGLASRIMYLISETSILNVDMAEPNAGVWYSDERFSSVAYQIEQALLNRSSGEPDQSMLGNLAETYRNAALIHLYRTIRRHRPDFTSAVSKKISAQVSEIVKRILDMPARCLVESSLLFPLFMAGGETDDANDIQIIRQRMLDIIRERHFHNMEAVLEVLEEVWQLRGTGVLAPGKRRVDWKDVVRRRGWMLSIT